MASNPSTHLGGLFKSSRKKGEEGLPLLSVTLNNGLIVRDQLDRRTETNLEASEHLLVQSGDIAYNMMRVWQGALGRASVNGLVSPAYVVLRPTAKIDSLYAEYLFKTPRMIYLFWAYSYGLTKDRLRLYFNDFSRIPVTIPNLKEQRKIAQILSTWDKAITTTEQLFVNSQQQKKALMQQLLTGKRRLLDKNGVRFEGEWSECLVEDFFDVGSSKRVLQKDWQSEGVPFYRTRELVSLSKNEPFRSEIFISKELFIDLSEKYGCPQEGDFLVSGVGTLGISYQVKNGNRFYFKDGNVLWFKLKVGINSDFFKYSFQSDFMQDQIMAQASVTTVGTFTIKNAKKTRFLCPPSVDEQQKIAAVLSTADQEICALKQKLDALKQEKKALMQQLLTGKRRVKIDDKEVA